MPFHSMTCLGFDANQIGKISFELNVDWFMKIAEEEDYVIITQHQDVPYEPHKFWVFCEEKITKVLEEGTSMELHGEYATECYETAIFQTLLEDPEFHDEFHKYFVSKLHFDWIEEISDKMSELPTGGMIGPNPWIEKLHDGRWGVKTLEDKAIIRERAGDWFVNQRVVLIADYPHVQAEEDFKRVATEMTGGKAKISVNF